MVRQKPRKTFEEVYGTKFEAAKPQGYNGKNSGVPQNQRDHGYIITSNTPFNCNNTPPLPPPSSATNTGGLGTSALNSSRRKSARPYGKPSSVGGNGNSYKYAGKEEKVDASKEHNSPMVKTSRGAGKEGSGSGGVGHDKGALTASHQYDNKTYRPYVETGREMHMVGDGNGNFSQRHHQHHQHQHHSHSNYNHHQHHDDDKDDDTEEFFQLIRQTVEKAIGKSISELLNRNFRELSSKVERFSVELKSTNEMLNKTQMDLNNKIVHYGEENSRHFRYLCMKSEYDKMFYQHQSMMSAAVVVPSTASPNLRKPTTEAPNTSVPSTKSTSKEDDNTPCTCRSSSQAQANIVETKIPHKTSSEERNVSQKSSEVSMRNVLEHIQRFCKQMQLNEMKDSVHSPDSKRLMNMMSGGGGLHSSGGDAAMDGYPPELAMKIDKRIFEVDDDDYGMSSDSMTPRSVENHEMHNQYGGMTVRGGNMGGGDGDAL